MGTPEGMKPRIAVLDDHDDTRELLHVSLEPEFDVQVFAHGASLLDAVEKEQFDLIVADIMMPELDGYQLIRELKSRDRSKNIPVIAFTALAMAHDRANVLTAGFAAYLIKPVEPQKVIDAIWRTLRPGKA
jgi:CheY-like chemotaxis protein